MAVGWAQAVVDFVFRIHFYKPILRVEPFDWGVAGTLITIAGVFGFVGASAAIAWNQFHREGPPKQVWTNRPALQESSARL